MRTIKESADWILECTNALENVETKAETIECLQKLEEAYNERTLIFAGMGKDYQWHTGYSAGVDKTLKLAIKSLEKIK